MVLRSLRGVPGFALTAFAALTLSIAATTTVFSVADSVLFRPLPYHDADRLVAVGADIRSRGLTNWAVGGDEFDAWRQSTRTLADLAGHQTFGRFTIGVPGDPVEAAASRVTENFLPLLGVAPAIGRHFNAADFVPGAPQAILLTERSFRQLFHADPSVVGQSVLVNDAPAVVIGVLPRSFAFPTNSSRIAPDILVPLVRTAASSGSRVTMVGRLADGVTVGAARVELETLAAARGSESGIRNARIDGASVTPLADELAASSRRIMWLLVGAVSAFLLMGCANVANLLLARGADRRAELAVRSALGASRAALIRLLLAESAVLAAAGCAAGALVAYWAVSVIAPLAPSDLTLLGPIEINTRALVCAVVVSAVCVLLAGLGPALGAARAGIAPTLNRAAGRALTGRQRARQVIVAVQVALAVVLLVGGGLMVNTLVRLLDVDHGYGPDGVLTMRVQLPRGREYPARSRAFVERTLAAAGAAPGVSVAGAVQGVPLARTLYAGHYSVEGFSQEWMREGMDRSGPCCTQNHFVSTRYFDAAGIPLVRGRRFTVDDAGAAPPVAIISERLARKFPKNIDPIGHYLAAGGDASDRRRIVGIVRDVRDMRLEDTPLQAIYLPMEEEGSSALTLVVRGGVDPWAIAGPVREAVQRQAGPVIIADVRPLDDVILASVGARRLNAWLFGSFGVLALVLAVIGIGGVISYSVARRTREIGLRLALGARPSQVRRLVMLESFTPVLIGLTAGVAAALGLSRFVATLLYDVAPRDVWTYAGVCLLLAASAHAAAYLPGRRAARVEPIVALRE